MLTLREQDREKVTEIIRRYLPDVDILAYGSRVNGDCHEGSDLDLAIRARDRQPLPVRSLSQIAEDLRDSNIPILVEVRDWARLPPSFQTDIERKHEMI
jgi:uncharacterized protein